MTISDSKIKQIIREETRRAILESNIKGGTFVPRPGFDISNLKPGDRIPASWFEKPSMSPEEGPGARAAMRMREPEMVSVGDPEYLASLDIGDEPEDEDLFGDEGLDEAKKKHKASAGTLAAFKKGAKGEKGGERKKRHAGFDAAAKSAKKWADEPGAVAQAATIKATGKPVVAKGEKKRIKESDNDTFVPHDYSGNKTMRWNPKVDRIEPFDIDSSGEDRMIHDPDIDYETGLPHHEPGGGDSMSSELDEHSRATFRKIVKEETLRFLRNRR
jgi:hypothetical protein